MREDNTLASTAAILLSCMVACISANAGTPGPVLEYPENPGWLHPVFSVSTGVASDFNKEVATSFFVPNSNYAFTPLSVDESIFILGLGIATENRIKQTPWVLDLGLAYYQGPQSMAISGSLVQGIDPQSSDTFHYSYQVSSNAILAEAKLLYKNQNRILPYLYVGAGSAFNHAENYHVNSSPLTFSPIFSDKSTTAFSYSLGVGVDVAFSNRVRVGCGYRYNDWGHARLGTGRIDSTVINRTLSNSNYSTNELLIQLIVLMA